MSKILCTDEHMVALKSQPTQPYGKPLVRLFTLSLKYPVEPVNRATHSSHFLNAGLGKLLRSESEWINFTHGVLLIAVKRAFL